MCQRIICLSWLQRDSGFQYVCTGKPWFKESTKYKKWTTTNYISTHEFLPHFWEFYCSKVPFHLQPASGFNMYMLRWNDFLSFFTINKLINKYACIQQNYISRKTEMGYSYLYFKSIPVVKSNMIGYNLNLNSKLVICLQYVPDIVQLTNLAFAFAMNSCSNSL